MDQKLKYDIQKLLLEVGKRYAKDSRVTMCLVRTHSYLLFQMLLETLTGRQAGRQRKQTPIYALASERIPGFRGVLRQQQLHPADPTHCLSLQ